MTKPTDAAEAAFVKLFNWIKSGREIVFGYRWHRDGFDATHMRHSPAGEFFYIKHVDGLHIYRFPAGTGFGYQGRIDMRSKSSVEDFIAASEKMTGAVVQL